MYQENAPRLLLNFFLPFLIPAKTGPVQPIPDKFHHHIAPGKSNQNSRT
jgi:hypothetical protein